MTSRAEIEIGADDSGAVPAWKRQADLVRQYGTTVGELEDPWRSADTAAQRYGRDVRKTIEESSSAQEKYETRLKKLKLMLDNADISQETYNNAVRKARAELMAADSAASGFGKSVLGNAAQFAGALTGIGSVLGGIAIVTSQINREYQNILDRQKEAANSQITTEVAQGQAYEALGQDPTMNREDLDRRVAEAATKYGVMPKDLYQASGGAFSARGSLSADTAFRSVEVAAQNSPGDIESVKELSQAIIDLQKVNPGASAEQVLGMIFGGLQSARVTSISSYAKNIKGVFQGQGYGDTAEQAMELFSTYTQAMGDRQGDTSATNLISLASQLRDALPELSSTTERIQFLRTDEGKAIRDRLLGTPGKKGTLSIEQQAKTTVMGLLGGDASNPVQQIYAAAQNAIAPIESGQDLFDQMQATKQASPLRQVADLDRKLKAQAEVTRLKNIREGEIETVRQGVADNLKALGNSDLSQRIAGIKFDASTILGGQTGAQTALDMLAAQEQQLRAEKTVSTPVGITGAMVQSRVPASSEELAQADALLPLIAIMRESVALQKQMLAQQQAQKPQPVQVEVKVQQAPQRPNKPRASDPPRERNSAKLQAGR